MCTPHCTVWFLFTQLTIISARALVIIGMVRYIENPVTILLMRCESNWFNFWIRWIIYLRFSRCFSWTADSHKLTFLISRGLNTGFYVTRLEVSKILRFKNSFFFWYFSCFCPKWLKYKKKSNSHKKTSYFT